MDFNNIIILVVLIVVIIIVTIMVIIIVITVVIIIGTTKKDKRANLAPAPIPLSQNFQFDMIIFSLGKDNKFQYFVTNSQDVHIWPSCYSHSYPPPPRHQKNTQATGIRLVVAITLMDAGGKGGQTQIR